MKKRYAGFITGMFFVVALGAVFIAGCGGSSGTGSYTVSGTLEIPDTTTGAARMAAAMGAATGTVQLSIVSATGTETIIAGPISTDDNGKYSFAVSNTYSYTVNHVIARAVVTAPDGATATLRTNVTGTTADITPVTEAAYQIITEKLVSDGKTFNDLTYTEVADIVTKVISAVGTSADSLADSLDTIINNAKSIAAFDADVQSALNSAVDDTSSAINYIVMANTPSGWSETQGDFAYMALTGSADIAPSATYNLLSPNPVNSDVAIAVDNSYVYILNRYGYDTVVVLDPAAGFSVTANYSLKENSSDATLNPQDIEIISSTKAYVTLNEKDYIQIINPLTGERTGTISLAPYTQQFGSGDTLDTIPEAANMVAVGSKVFVAVQNLDRSNYWATTDYAKVVVIDTSTDTAVASIDLSANCGQNPTGDLVYAYNLIYLTCSGSTFNPTGPESAGIASIDPATYAVTKIASKGDGDFSCSPSNIAIASATKGYFTCITSWPTTAVYAFNPSTGDVNSTAIFSGSVGFDLGIDPDGNLVVPSRDTSAPGLLFFDTSTDEQVYSSVVPVGLMPEAFDFFTYTP